MKAERKTFVFYVSDHGFGHVARNIPIAAQLVRSTPHEAWIVCGGRQTSFARANLSGMLTQEELSRVHLRTAQMDVGLIVRPGTLLVDAPALESACAAYLGELPGRAQEETDWLRAVGAAAALCDMPLWSIEACRLAGVPLLYVGNFTWTELYREFLPETIWRAYAREYAKLRHGMLYALHNPEMLEFLPNAQLRETSVVARPFHPERVRALRAERTQPAAFVALGMSAQFERPVDVSGQPVFFYATEGVPMRGPNVELVPYSTLDTQDYIAASDFVITKAGWGTVAECLLAKKPMALFARDGVLEDRTTIRLLEARGLAVRIEADELNDVRGIAKKLEQVNTAAFSEFYDAAQEIAEALAALGA